MADRNIRHRPGNDHRTELEAGKIIDDILNRGGYRLMIDNLHYEVDDHELKSLFGIIGCLKRATVFYDKSGRSRGSGEIVFPWVVDAFRAMRAFNGLPFWGKPLRITCGGRISDGRMDRIKWEKEATKRQYLRLESRRFERESSRRRDSGRRVTEREYSKHGEARKPDRDYSIARVIRRHLSEREHSLARDIRRHIAERDYSSSVKSPKNMDCSPSRESEMKKSSPDKEIDRKPVVEKELSPLTKIRKQVAEREFSPPKEISRQITTRRYQLPVEVREEIAQMPSEISVVEVTGVNYFPVAETLSVEPEMEVMPPPLPPQKVYTRRHVAERLYYYPRSKYVWKRQNVSIPPMVVTKADLDKDIDDYMEQKKRMPI